MKRERFNTVVLGAGAWGTALAIHVAECGQNVTLVARSEEKAMEMLRDRENRIYLPGVPFPAGMQMAFLPGPALLEARVAIVACPSFAVAATCQMLAEVRKHCPSLEGLILVGKGLDPETREGPVEICRRYLPDLRVGVLSGPARALEVARKQPTAVTLAGQASDKEWLSSIQEAWSSAAFRIYLSDDVTGVELGGCLKNIYAIAVGCCDGLGLGDNARAALLCRALAEMVRIARVFGAKEDTLYGLSGMGDLVATACGDWSRNRNFGFELAKGSGVRELMENRLTVVEGFYATRLFRAICREKQIEAPILEQVYAMIFEEISPREAVERLMNRTLKKEV